MTRGVGFLALLALPASAGCWGGGEGTPESPPPAPVGDVARDARTVVLVVADDLRAAHVGAYGYPLDTTPAIDALAAEGLVFTDCVTASTGLNASLASLLTGRFAQEHGVGSLRHRGQHRLVPSETTLAEAFRDAGWATFGAVSRPQLRGDLSGLDQGFERWLAPALHEGELRTADQTFYNARPELAELLASERPVLALLHFSDTGAREPPQGVDGARFLRDHLAPFTAERPLLAQALQRVDEDPGGALEDVLALLERGRGTDPYLALRAASYDARLCVLDRHVGELFELLRESGRYERALVVVTGTRGALLAPPREAGAPAFVSDVVRTPLVVRFPGGAPRARVDALVQSVDLAPTLAEACTWDDPPPFSGASLLDVVERARRRAGPAFCEAASFERRAALDARFLVEENRVGGLVAWTRGGTRVVESALEEDDAARVEALREALARFRRPAQVLVASGGGAPVEVRWRFASGFAGPARVEAGGDATEGTSHAARAVGLAGRATLGAGPERLVCEASHRELPVRLELDFGERAVDEERIFVGTEPLPDTLVPRLASSAAPPWPSDEAGEPLPCDAELDQQGGTWWRLSVGHERGATGRPVEVLVALHPPGPLDERLEWSAGVEVEAAEIPGRADVVIFRGRTPLEVQLEKTPARDFGIAVRLEGRTLDGAAVRHRGRTFAEPGEIALYLPDWVPGVTDALLEDVAETVPPGVVRITRRGPNVASEERSALDFDQLGFVEQLGGGE